MASTTAGSQVTRTAAPPGPCSAWARRSAAAKSAGTRAVGDDHDLGRTRERLDADRARDLALGEGDVAVPGADDHVDRADGLGAVRERGDRLRATDPVHLGDADQRRGRERRRRDRARRRRGARRARARRRPRAARGSRSSAPSTGRRRDRRARRGRPVRPGSRAPGGTRRRGRAWARTASAWSAWYPRIRSAATSSAVRSSGGVASSAARRSSAVTRGSGTSHPSKRSGELAYRGVAPGADVGQDGAHRVERIVAGIHAGVGRASAPGTSVQPRRSSRESTVGSS